MTGTASIGNSRSLGKVDGTQYHSRSSHHSADICGPYSRTDTVGTVSAVPLFGFEKACRYTPGGALLPLSWNNQSSTTGLLSRAGSASRHAHVPRCHLPGLGLESGYAQLR